MVGLIKETGEIGKYITLEIIESADLNNVQVAELIKLTDDIGKYITPEIIKAANLNNSQVLELIKAIDDIGKYITPEIIEAANLYNYQVLELVKATGNIGEYLTPEKIKEYKLSFVQVEKLIKATGEIGKYITPEIIEAANLKSYTVVDLIKATDDIGKYITPEIIKAAKLSDYEVKELIKATDDIGKYITPEIIKEYKLYSSEVVGLIKETGEIGKYITPEIIKTANLIRFEVIELIEATDDIGKYITPEIIKTARLIASDVVNLIKKTGNIGKYITPEIIKEYKLNSSQVVGLIKETEEIGKYITPEIIKAANLTNSQIDELIKETGDVEPYLLKGQNKYDENLRFTMANVVKHFGPEKIEEYLGSLEKVYKLEAASDIKKLILESPNPEKYLFEGQNIENSNLSLNISNVIKGNKLCPNLTRNEIELLCSFNEYEIIKTVTDLEPEKQGDAIYILNRLSRSNSDELRRIKVPIALQILEKEPEKYEDTLNKVEEIYLTNNIPTVGKSYLVFEELHPNFLGNDSNNRKDDSYANIPSLNVIKKAGRRNIIYSDLLRCAIESNNRNLREYLELIENGNELYEQFLSGNLKVDELDNRDKNLEILTRYSEILNTLYNSTSRGKREETYRENSGNLEDDLNELNLLL